MPELGDDIPAGGVITLADGRRYRKQFDIDRDCYRWFEIASDDTVKQLKESIGYVEHPRQRDPNEQPCAVGGCRFCNGGEASEPEIEGTEYDRAVEEIRQRYNLHRRRVERPQARADSDD